MSEISDKVKQFVATELLYDDNAVALTDDTPLLGGVIDSLGLMQLVSYIEEEFDVVVDDEEVTVDNFRTVGDIERLISSKVGAA